MRRMETKRITSSRPSLAITKTYTKSDADVIDILDTDEDRVMLYYTHHLDNKHQVLVNKRSSSAYRSVRN